MLLQKTKIIKIKVRLKYIGIHFDFLHVTQYFVNLF